MGVPLAKGRFGIVWKAKLDEEWVAVKVFPLREKPSWEAEREIFQLPRISHENILRFIGVKIVSTGLDKDFWLVTEFHERGN